MDIDKLNGMIMLGSAFQPKLEAQEITIPYDQSDITIEIKKNILIIFDEDNGQSADQIMRISMPVGHFCFIKFNRIGDTYLYSVEAPFKGFVVHKNITDIAEYPYHTIFNSTNWVIVYRGETNYHLLAKATNGAENGTDLG